MKQGSGCLHSYNLKREGSQEWTRIQLNGAESLNCKTTSSGCPGYKPPLDNDIINGPNHMQMKRADTGEERGWLQEAVLWSRSGEIWEGFVQDTKDDVEKTQWFIPPVTMLLSQSWRTPDLLSLPPRWSHHSLGPHTPVESGAFCYMERKPQLLRMVQLTVPSGHCR